MADHHYSEPSLAALYDAFCAGRSDFAFYLPLVMAAKRVLERKREGQQRPVEPDQELEALKQSLRDRAQVIAQRRRRLTDDLAVRAEFGDAYTTGSPPAVVPSGAKLPGVPSKQAYAELAWIPGRWSGLDTALEVQYVDKLYVNERNTDAAPAYAVMNARLGFSQSMGSAKWSEFVRVNNLFDRNYAGSVIVGDGNGRFFEPAPGRNWFVGARVDVKL